MESKENEVVISQPSLKRLRKDPKDASSSPIKVGPAKRFGAKAVEPHELKWFNTQKEVKYATENWIDEGLLVLEFPNIRDNLHKLGVGYIFVELEECNLTFVREFYVNWDTSFGESTKVKIRVTIVRLE
ncbi:hypothetical protein HAX54_003638 [Datura stramonium]|uniref:Uncharacterized protein n=1 Tax=Datura stramonium TaxID=4076 RepID=A0ABS8T758_DATST|nr:hypothetical protein [Datura stramonium]